MSNQHSNHVSPRSVVSRSQSCSLLLPSYTCYTTLIDSAVCKAMCTRTPYYLSLTFGAPARFAFTGEEASSTHYFTKKERRTGISAPICVSRPRITFMAFQVLWRQAIVVNQTAIQTAAGTWNCIMATIMSDVRQNVTSASRLGLWRYKRHD